MPSNLSRKLAFFFNKPRSIPDSTFLNDPRQMQKQRKHSPLLTPLHGVTVIAAPSTASSGMCSAVKETVTGIHKKYLGLGLYYPIISYTRLSNKNLVLILRLELLVAQAAFTFRPSILLITGCIFKAFGLLWVCHWNQQMGTPRSLDRTREQTSATKSGLTHQAKQSKRFSETTSVNWSLKVVSTQSKQSNDQQSQDGATKQASQGVRSGG